MTIDTPHATRIDFKAVVLDDGRVAVAGRTLLPQDAFDFARQLCDAAYTAQGGPAKDPDERYEQHLAREARAATWFEELYCRIRDIAADFHREAVRRQSGEEHGQFHADDLDPQKAVDGVGKQVVKTIKDWDY